MGSRREGITQGGGHAGVQCRGSMQGVMQGRGSRREGVTQGGGHAGGREGGVRMRCREAH
eukprot:532457-Prorocentrum_minimum.AAC.1